MAPTLKLNTCPERSRGKINTLSTLLIYFSILIFIIGFNFTDSPPPFGWYQQFIPSIGNRQISDITFIDSLSGFLVTSFNSNDTSFIVKTTNSGDNWFIVYRQIGGINGGFSKVYFLNNNLGFCTGFHTWKTTNSGLNWVLLSDVPTSYPYLNDISVLNEDTLWVVSNSNPTGGVFLTTNGGVSWITQYSIGSANPTHIYMFNARFGFMDGGGLKRTSDGGTTWMPIPSGDYFTHMYFIDSLTGWKCNGYMKKTTDGGFNWVTQTLPYGGIIITSEMNSFSNVNRDSIWGAGGWLQYPNFQSRGLLYRTTNGGNNWLYQVPDTSINIFEYFHIIFINRLNGWAFAPSKGVHTVTGGNDTFYTSVRTIVSTIADKFNLGQNYPNPFNPKTNIKYQIVNNSYVKLTVYDIMGKEVSTLVNEKQTAGEHVVDFDGSGLSSGVYFYKIEINTGKEVFTDTKKMLLIK